MTVVGAVPVVASWREPETIRARGTVIVVPGRGEHAGVYERFGRRIAADGYRVWAVSDPTFDEARTTAQIQALLDTEPSAEPDRPGPHPRVLVGSDTGALFAAGLVARQGRAGQAGRESAVAGLVLAGLPAATGPAPAALSWDDELAARTSCPTHQGRLAGDDAVRRGALAERVPTAWFGRADPAAVTVPVLGVHGAEDPLSPLAAVRPWYARLPAGELVSIVDGVHDALNDQTHRTAAATVVLFLERLRLGAGAPALARAEALQ